LTNTTSFEIQVCIHPAKLGWGYRSDGKNKHMKISATYFPQIHGRTGFTLIELAAVLAISKLAALRFPSITSMIKRGHIVEWANDNNFWADPKY